jgi:hypothetical protein
MTPENISVLRTLNQQITNPKFKSAKEIAGWMGALQAQDYSMSKWAFGIRLQNSTEIAINREINSGNIIRSHLLRPTWHFVSSDDIYWILELTATQIKAVVKFRDKQLGLTENIFHQCNIIIEKALRDFNHKTREELISELLKANIEVDNNRASHILLHAEIEGIICSGKQKGSKPTYAILEEWVPKHRKTYREEALKELARRYFTSRGPATVRDFTWWSGLSSTDSKLAIELNRPQLISEIIGNQTYWFIDSGNTQIPDLNEIYLLPAYDEFIISYRDRKTSLSLTDHEKVVSDNGIFYPTILIRGQVIGTWKRVIKNNFIVLTANLFSIVSPDLNVILSDSTIMYSKFMNKEIELIISQPS